MRQLEREAWTKVVIVAGSPPYLNNRCPIAALPRWSVLTCHLTLAIGLTQHSETMSGYNIMKGTPRSIRRGHGAASEHMCSNQHHLYSDGWDVVQYLAARPLTECATSRARPMGWGTK
jgi:hypothetical protein